MVSSIPNTYITNRNIININNTNFLNETIQY